MTRKWLRGIVCCAALAVMWTVTSPANVQAAVDNSHMPVTVYKDWQYEGASGEFGPGEYDWDAISSAIGNDEMSSIRIQQGYQVTLFKDAGFQGKSQVLYQDCYGLGEFGLNDEVSSMIIEAADPMDETCVSADGLSDSRKSEIMRMFAPRTWLAADEQYRPSSVEFALPYLDRAWDDETGAYRFFTKEAMPKTDTKLGYFSGDLVSAKVYSFWTEKAYNNVDISYFLYYPYNLGKKVVGTEFGNHVGDWEHITVRLAHFEWNGREYLKPVMVKYPSHNFANPYNWKEVEKVNGTHPVAYSAKGSHGMWKDPGIHTYMNIVVTKLQDECSAGTAWDAWESLETYEYFPLLRQGRGLAGSEWKSYFDVDYSNPDSLSVYLWGNRASGSLFGQQKLANGPSGPQEKWALSDYTIFD